MLRGVSIRPFKTSLKLGPDRVNFDPLYIISGPRSTKQLYRTEQKWLSRYRVTSYTWPCCSGAL